MQSKKSILGISIFEKWNRTDESMHSADRVRKKRPPSLLCCCRLDFQAFFTFTMLWTCPIQKWSRFDREREAVLVSGYARVQTIEVRIIEEACRRHVCTDITGILIKFLFLTFLHTMYSSSLSRFPALMFQCLFVYMVTVFPWDIWLQTFVCLFVCFV